MKLSLLLGSFALAISVVTASATNYAGNGDIGFGGQVGNGMLSITADGAGNVTFTEAPAYANATTDTFGNALVLYINTGAAGLANTSTLSDDSNGATEAVSGYNASNPSRTLVTFSPGFTASYALFFDGGNINLFQIGVGATNSTLNFIVNQPLANTAGENPSITFPLTDLGLTTGGGFTFVGTLLSETAYRSNETIGTSTTTDGSNNGTGNGGFTGGQTFTSFDTLVPEPGAYVYMGLGAIALAGLSRFRLRRA